jgi:putative hydrolase of the HAD superfamily
MRVPLRQAEDATPVILRRVRYRAVFFDAGETLVHPAPSFSELFSSVVTREGHPRQPQDVLGASRVVLSRFSEAARDNELWTTSPERSRRFWIDVYGRMLAALDLPTGDGLRDLLYREFTRLDNYALFDDVRPLLHSLSASGATSGALLGIVSNYEAWLEELLGALGVLDSFPVRVISGIEGIEKPNPRVYELALERAGVAASSAVFVGDNPEFDVTPPAALGMFTVLIDRRERHPDHAGARITDLGELSALLEDS